jgi:hypothetical protein
MNKSKVKTDKRSKDGVSFVFDGLFSDANKTILLLL